MSYKLTDAHGAVIAAGTLDEIGPGFYEQKLYFNGSIHYLKPVCKIDGVEIQLNQTQKGFKGVAWSADKKYGCNFSRVQNRKVKNRWGLTVWIEANQKAAS